MEGAVGGVPVAGAFDACTKNDQLDDSVWNGDDSPTDMAVGAILYW